MFNQVADLFHDLDMGMLPISVIFPYLPIPAHWNRDRCRTSHDIIFMTSPASCNASASAGATAVQDDFS